MNGIEIVAIAILGGFAVGRLIGLAKLPAVAGYVLLGIVLGQSVSGFFPLPILQQVDVLSDLALGVIAFTIGGELKWANLSKIAGSVFPIVLLEASGAMLLVTLSVWWLRHDWPLALILGSISAATAPAATMMVIRETRARGPLSSTLIAVVGIDDAIALTLYGVAATIAKALLSGGGDLGLEQVLTTSAREIFGAVLLGGVCGIGLALAVKRVDSRDSLFVIGIGSVLLVAGLAQPLQVSPLLANMALGAVLINMAPASSQKLFGQIELLGAPILIAFFVVAGAHLRLDLLPTLGILGLVYLLARISGKVAGAWLGAVISNAPRKVRDYIGFGLLSQVGIAIGLSLVVARDFASLGVDGHNIAETVINVLLATTIVTELVGPGLTKFGLIRAGEAGQSTQTDEEQT